MLAMLQSSGSLSERAEFTGFSIPISGNPATFDEVVDAIAPKLGVKGCARDDTRVSEFARDIAKIAIGSLLYLCSTVVDDERVPHKSISVRSNGATTRLADLHKIGWKIGAALSARRSSGGKATGTGNAHGPQHRKAHFKTVWTGPGRSIPKTVFIHPYWTKRDEIESPAAFTVRRVAGVGQ